jgi:ubiquinone/menaquinone biosynthesis C-methylase UbiE
VDPTDVFTSKAIQYARYRWDYAPQAVQTLFDLTRISPASVVADIGAGTGILTAHLLGKVKRIYAVEPNANMRRFAAQALGADPSCQVIEGRAEATALPDRCLNLIVVAQAIHWCEPHATKREFARIAAPGCWLALLRNYGTDAELGAALAQVYPQESDTDTAMVGKGEPRSFYYDAGFVRRTFPFVTRSAWESFLGSLSTASYAPDEHSPHYAGFRQAARSVFERFSVRDVLELHGETELYLGRIAPNAE